MNTLLILTSYTKFELNSLRSNEITIKLPITDIFNYGDTTMVMTSWTFAKFEKFLPHTIIIPSFMSVGSQMPELNLGAPHHIK